MNEIGSSFFAILLLDSYLCKSNKVREDLKNIVSYNDSKYSYTNQIINLKIDNFQMIVFANNLVKKKVMSAILFKMESKIYSIEIAT